MTYQTPSVSALVDELHAAIAAAEEKQWEQPARMTAGGGGGSAISDPTASTALDPARLKLRAAVIAAERTLDEARASLEKALADLAAADARYDGRA